MKKWSNKKAKNSAEKLFNLNFSIEDDLINSFLDKLNLILFKTITLNPNS